MHTFNFFFRSLIIIAILLINIKGLNAQCISGDCENGIGEMQLSNGIYKGAFKNREPHGEGIFYGTTLGVNRLDSLRNEGTFKHGMFLKGKRHIIKSWDEWGAPSTWYGKQEPVKVGNRYRYTNSLYDKDAGRSSPYPRELTFDVTETSPKGKKKSWKEKGLRFDEGDYKGGIKNGLPHGKGSFSNGFIKFDGTFEDGIPTSMNSEAYNYLDIGRKKINSMQIANGMITNMVLTSFDTSQVFKLLKPKSVLDFLFLADYDGYYEVTNRTGLVYTGMINKWQYNGSGELAFKDGVYKGQFFQNKYHGIGVRESALAIDSGLWIAHAYKTGYTTLKKNNKRYKYPVCISGNCENGFGKISYLINSNDTVYRIYEGNMIESMPNGEGTFKERNGNKFKSMSGNYVHGVLNGNGTYEGNIGVVTKMTGTFENDTLRAGTISYTDGSAFEFNDVGAAIPHNIVTSNVFKKHVKNSGKYFTPGGAVVEGAFYDFGRVFDAMYADKSGNRFRIGFNINGDEIDFKDLDWWGKKYIALIAANDESKRRAAAAYAEETKRQEHYAMASKNPANFQEGYENVTCSACSGKGYIISGYAVGSISYVSQEYMDNSGNWRRDLKAFVPAHNVTSRTPCEACHKRGTITIKTKKYIGPKY